MRYLLIIFFCSCICLSCERRSGRKNSDKNLTTTTQTQQAKKQQSRVVVNKPTSVSFKTSMSGSDIFDKYNSAVFMILTSDGKSGFQGSGFFISDNGIAVSNYHVFKGTKKGLEIIKLSDGSTFKVKEVIGYDEDDDYILFRVGVGNHKVNYIPISMSTPKVGEKAYAIGSPRGLENTFSSGEISQIRDGNVLQISVPIDHGSSGGALINCFGEVVGITTAVRDDSGANLNFAMSIKVISKHLN